MYFVDRSAVVLKPTEAFLEWLKQSDDDLPDITLAQLRANCSVYLVPEFETREQAVAYLSERYREVFAGELAGWITDESEWPETMDLPTFWTFFELDVHDTVLDLEEADLQIEPVFGSGD